jgi:hypothetical protein
LSVIAHRKPEFFDQVKRLAMQICGADPSPSLYAQAVLIAESELMLRLISIERRAVIEHFRDALAVPGAKRAADIGIARIRLEQTKIAYEEFSQLSAKLAEQGEKSFTVIKPRKCDPGDPPHKFRPPKDLDEYEALQKALPYLERFERYERRAWSRRKKAIRLFTEQRLAERQCISKARGF